MSNFKIEKATKTAAETVKKNPILWVGIIGVGGVVLLLISRANGAKTAHYAGYPEPPAPKLGAPGVGDDSRFTANDSLFAALDAVAVAMTDTERRVADSLKAQQVLHERTSADLSRQISELVRLPLSTAIPFSDAVAAPIPAAPAAAALVGFGGGGADYHRLAPAARREMETARERLRTDKTFRQSEIIRAQGVIAAREGAGMETTAQRRYLADLKRMDIAAPTAAPVVARPAAPVATRPAAPVIARPAAPVIARPAAPVIARPAAPVATRPVAPAVIPAVTRPVAPVVIPAVTRPVAPVAARIGFGGADYHRISPTRRRAMETARARLRTDPGFRQSEIRRAEGVIATRRHAGLETSAQRKYLADLKKM